VVLPPGTSIEDAYHFGRKTWSEITLVQGYLQVGDSHYEWRRQGSKPVRWSRDKPLPRHLNEKTSPKVGLTMAPQCPVGAMVWAQDALAGAGVFCVHPAMDGPVEGKVPIVGDGHPEVLRIGITGMIPVHFSEVSGAGGSLHLRHDGVMCSKRRAKIAATPPKPTQVPKKSIRDVLKPSPTASP
jgi:hypothetical protein